MITFKLNLRYRIKRINITLSVLAVLVACGSAKQTTGMEEQTNDANDATSQIDSTTPKVTGIGGIFFYSDNQQETREWYAKNLGLDFTAWGSSSFESRDIHNPEVVNTLEWMPFKPDSEHFAPSKKEFMINYTVQNIEGLVEKLTENDVTVLDSIASYDYGKFVHIMDADGNKIELWEPAR